MEKKDFGKLIEYYYRCVVEDREFKIVRNAVTSSGRFKRTYLHLKDEQFQKFMKKEFLPSDLLAGVRNELKISDQKNKEIEYLIGYLILHKKQPSTIIPAFLFVIVEETDRCSVDYEDVHFNTKFFEETNIDLNNFRSELEKLKLSDTINNQKPDILLEIKKLVSRFIRIDESIDNIGTIYSERPVIFTHDKSNFTKGLEHELKELAYRFKTSDDMINQSALKYLFESNAKVFEFDNPIMFTTLNPSQIQSIKLALSSGITNIQGPPGTGKSDVVMNIIFNAFLENKSVLFSSKNHKAIETVIIRIENYLENLPFMLKLGRTEGENGEKQLGRLLMERINSIMAINDFMPLKNIDLIELRKKASTISKEIEKLETLQREINDFRSEISEVYRRFIKGKYTSLELIFSNLRNLQTINRAALLSPRIKRMVLYLDSMRRAQNLDRIEELTEEIFTKRNQLVKINKNILKLTIRKIYSSIDLKEKDTLLSYINLLGFWIDGSFNSREERSQFKEKFKSIRKILRTWAVSNLSVSGQLPMDSGIFDYVIIDEASQCDIPSSLCLMLRSRSFIVVGDEMQLTHITNLSQKRRFQLFKENFDLLKYDEWEYGSSSILNLVKKRSNNLDGNSEIMLDEHFRSKKEIISFSNSYFYANRLQLRTDYLQLKEWQEKDPFDWVQVDGTYTREYLKLFVHQEVEVCRSLLSELIKDEKIKSIGIISPFRLQVKKIYTACEDIISANINEKEIIVDTISRFQGDEKDVIIFSLAVSNPIKIEDKLRNNNEAFYSGNNNLINVGLTRAKSNLLIVGNKQFCKVSECDILKKLAAYSEKTEIPNPHQPETHEEQILVTALKNVGFQPKCQYDFFTYRMDMAIIQSGRKLCIEVDGSQHEGAVPGSRNSYDNVRDYTMQREGWKVLRFWNYEVWHDLDRCVDRIKSAFG